MNDFEPFKIDLLVWYRVIPFGRILELYGPYLTR